MYPTPESHKYPEIAIIDDAMEDFERGLITEERFYVLMEVSAYVADNYPVYSQLSLKEAIVAYKEAEKDDN